MAHADEIPAGGCVRVKLAIAKRFAGTEELDLSEGLPDGMTLCPNCAEDVQEEIDELVEQDDTEAEGDGQEDDGLSPEERAAKAEADAKAAQEAAAAKAKREKAEVALCKKYGVVDLAAAEANWLAMLNAQEEDTPAFDFWNSMVDSFMEDLYALDA
ncbi:hypothetical protein [Kitasatospora sp. NPDC056800]|uniref:hypothetical protein n=1 Tax=Kitasatospora sp. NPDC056800 TaxID=3345948 RepID=UPI0036C57A9E